MMIALIVGGLVSVCVIAYAAFNGSEQDNLGWNDELIVIPKVQPQPKTRKAVTKAA